MHRRVLASGAALIMAAVTILSAAPAGAAVALGGSAWALAQQPEDDPDGDPTTDDAPLPDHDMIPEPNSGRAPNDAGDRGGALQGLVLLFIVIGVGGIAVLAVRESRRDRARRIGPSDREAQQIGRSAGTPRGNLLPGRSSTAGPPSSADHREPG